jgi:hypothetical protein
MQMDRHWRERGAWPPYDDSYFDDQPAGFGGWGRYQRAVRVAPQPSRRPEPFREPFPGPDAYYDHFEYRRRPGPGDHVLGESFAGRGPRGYRRSDERIREEVCERLTDAFDVDASEVDVQVENGEVTLGGSVTSRHAKRRVEDIADAIHGVADVHNQLRIVGPPLPDPDDATVMTPPSQMRPPRNPGRGRRPPPAVRSL